MHVYILLYTYTVKELSCHSLTINRNRFNTRKKFCRQLYSCCKSPKFT